MSANSQPIARHDVRTVVAAAVGLSLGPSVIALLSFGVFMPPLEAEFGWSRVEVSFATSLVSYMLVLISPLQGWLVDRFGSRRLVLCSIPAFAVGLTGFYFLSSSLVTYYLLWGLLPWLAIGLWPLSYLRAVGSWTGPRLGLRLGIANGGIGIGAVAIPILASMLIATVGWRAMFLCLGLVVLAITWPLAFVCLHESPRARESAAASDGVAADGLSFREALRTREFRILLATFALLGLSLNGILTQQISMLVESGWSPQRAALVQATSGATLLIARVVVGYAIDRFFAPRVLMLVVLGGAVTCILYATFPTAAFVGAALLGIAIGAEFDILAFLIRRYFGVFSFGRLYGMIFAVFQLASGIGITAMALGREHYGAYSPVLFGLAAILLMAAYLPSRLSGYRYAALQASPGAAVANQRTD